MFDKLISSFQMYKKADAPPVNSDFLRPKVEPAKKPAKMLPERKALPAAIQEKPPTILLPSVSAAPAVATSLTNAVVRPAATTRSRGP